MKITSKIKKIAEEFCTWVFAREKDPRYNTLKHWVYFKYPEYMNSTLVIFNEANRRLFKEGLENV